MVQDDDIGSGTPLAPRPLLFGPKSQPECALGAIVARLADHKEGKVQEPELVDVEQKILS